MSSKQTCAVCAHAEAGKSLQGLKQAVVVDQAAQGTNLIARQNSCLVCRPSPNGCQNNKSATGGLLGNEQANSLHLPVAADPKICILPTSTHTQR